MNILIVLLIVTAILMIIFGALSGADDRPRVYRPVRRMPTDHAK